MNTRRSVRGGGLYLAWRLNGTDADSVQNTTDRLARGEREQLYRLCSWVVADGEVQALLAPVAPLEQIAEAIRTRPAQGEGEELRARWIFSPQTRAEVARDIEIVPVQLGLARRPEEWPFSSASRE